MWWEDEVFCVTVKDFEDGKGKTGKGLLHFFSEPGGYRCLDMEDIVTITPGQTLKHARILV